MNKINGVEALQTWLQQEGIDTSTWGVQQTKSVHSLWEELEHGEIILHEQPPLREVEVVQIVIRRDDYVLLEVEQELGNGRFRSRNIFPSEKLRGGEDYLEAAKRGLQEEMNLDPQEVTFVRDSYEKNRTTIASPSYPNLPTRYTIHRIEAAVSDLPGRDFWCINDGYEEGDPVKQHCWGWRREEELVVLS
ncbi:MAG: NUDIX domain-containing protein [Chloroflexota bacterium]